MATTPGGLPYPVGTDFVVDGDNAIRALAEELDGPVYAHFTMKPATSGGVRPYVGGAVAWDGTKVGTDTSVLSADKTEITLGKTGLYAVEFHGGLGGNPGNGATSSLLVDGAVFSASLMYGNTGAAGAFMSVSTVYVVAVGGTTKIKQSASSPQGIYDWSWLRITYLRRNRA